MLKGFLKSIRVEPREPRLPGQAFATPRTDALARGIAELRLALECSGSPLVAVRPFFEKCCGSLLVWYERPIWRGRYIYLPPPGTGPKYGPVRLPWPFLDAPRDWGEEAAEKIREHAEPPIWCDWVDWP